MFKHLHIVGCSPRSGTTLLHEVMLTCFAFDKHYEHETRFHRTRAEPGQRLLAKCPKDTLHMPAVLDAVPDLFVLYLLRDPRDTICSRHGKDRSIYYSNIRVWRQMQASAARLAGHPRFLTLRYEAFVTDPDTIQREIATECPWLEKQHEISRYHEFAEASSRSRRAMTGVRPIAPTSVGVWKDNLGRIKAQQAIHGSLTHDLIEAGYEGTDEWEASLDGIDPDETPSRYSEQLNVAARISQKLDTMRKAKLYRHAQGI